MTYDQKEEYLQGKRESKELFSELWDLNEFVGILWHFNGGKTWQVSQEPRIIMISGS